MITAIQDIHHNLHAAWLKALKLNAQRQRRPVPSLEMDERSWRVSVFANCLPMWWMLGKVARLWICFEDLLYSSWQTINSENFPRIKAFRSVLYQPVECVHVWTCGSSPVSLRLHFHLIYADSFPARYGRMRKICETKHLQTFTYSINFVFFFNSILFFKSSSDRPKTTHPFYYPLSSSNLSIELCKERKKRGKGNVCIVGEEKCRNCMCRSHERLMHFQYNLFLFQSIP